MLGKRIAKTVILLIFVLCVKHDETLGDSVDTTSVFECSFVEVCYTQHLFYSLAKASKSVHTSQAQANQS